MTITQETVEQVARLARLELSTDEVNRYQQDLANILTLVDQLNQLNLDEVSIGMTLNQPTVLRPDIAESAFSRDDLLKNAPQEEEGFFRVPQILET